MNGLSRNLGGLARVCVGLIGTLYALGFLVWRASLALPATADLWQLQVSQVFASWLYLPLPLLVLLAMIARRRWAFVALLVPLLFFVAEYGAQFVPYKHVLAAETSSAPSLRAMTWNSLRSRDRSGEFEAQVAESAPDLIALQEVGYGMDRILQERLGAQYPYQQVHYGGSGSLALLSRFPILDAEVATSWEDCMCLQAVIDYHGQPITVINTHVWGPTLQIDGYRAIPRMRNFNAGHQRITFDALLERSQQVTMPLIVMGDFNTTERQPNLRRLSRELANAYSEVGEGMGYTFPNRMARPGRSIIMHLLPMPLIRIDHILHDNAWRAQAAWTGALSESDHLYVVADLGLTQPANR